MITPEMYNELREQEQQGQEMVDEKNSSIQLKKMIKTDLQKWSKTKDGKSYKLFYQLEQLR